MPMFKSGDRVLCAETTRRQVDATIEGVKRKVWVEETIAKPGTVVEVATLCAQVMLDERDPSDGGELPWFHWPELSQETSAAKKG